MRKNIYYHVGSIIFVVVMFSISNLKIRGVYRTTTTFNSMFGVTTLEFLDSNKFIFYEKDSSFYSSGFYGQTISGNIWYQSDGLDTNGTDGSYTIGLLRDTLKMIHPDTLYFRGLILVKSE
jgi:hypothetical protein